MKKLIYKNEKGASALLSSLNERAAKYNAAYQTFSRLNLGDTTLEEIQFAIANFSRIETSEFIREKIYEKNSTLKALPLNKVDILKMIELPEGFKNFATAVESLVLPFGSKYPPIAFFKIEDDKVILNEEFLNNYIDSKFCYYLETKEEEDAYELMVEIQNLLNRAKPHFEDQMANILIGKGITAVLSDAEKEIKFQPKAFLYHIKKIKDIHNE
ncbi:MAG: hypothetical protein J7604_03520 [Sporocytophaga sp.]|uniref:hypothetical protein n=1 Tax=Sporocytophaga sp. TaxID=2231183 RepID=UPI001B0D79D0|nr:hypothetical protein [Sporocytophaga sp.]MBO9699250.1 hypothetical protein [Sporocytophaga sp.]